MKDIMLNNAIGLIKTKYNYDEIRMAELEYGLQCMYSLITKFIVFTCISIICGILKEYLIFIFFYNFLRMYGCGFHANTNLQCYALSFVTFIILPLLASYISFDLEIKLIISLAFSLILIKYAPADTQKKPIIDIKKRKIMKIKMLVICLIYNMLLLFVKNYVISNLIFFSLISETIFVLPITYFLFNQRYNNYRNYKFTKGGISC